MKVELTAEQNCTTFVMETYHTINVNSMYQYPKKNEPWPKGVFEHSYSWIYVQYCQILYECS